MSWLYSIVFAGLLFTSGGETTQSASIEQLPGTRVAALAQSDETEVFEQSYPLNPNGRVSVSNINGSIVVEAWDRNEVKLTATKIADSKETLQDVEIRVDARPEYLSVEADYDEMKWRDRSDKDRHRRIEVQFKLSVPRTASLNEVETVNGSVTVSNFVNFTKISAVNGNVNAGNLRGAANLSTVNGEVAADFDRLEPGTKINLSTVNGRVNLTIPSDANATLKADSLNGNISNEFGLPVRKGEYVGRDLYGRVGSGDVQIKLNSVNGALAINRQKDGKSPNAPTNLLPTKRGSEDLDDDSQGVVVNTDRINRDVARAMRQANIDAAKATREAMKETEKLKDLKDLKVKVDVDLKDVDVDLKDMEVKLNEGLKARTRALADMRDAMWLGGGPSIERKSNSFAVKGTPTVTIDAESANVKVRGWDKQEVRYVLTELSSRRARNSATVTEEQNSSGVGLKVVTNRPEREWLPDDGQGVRIEVFVPRKSNLKISTEGEIRLEGVSGEVELKGGDGPIDVRGSEGRLTISNTDGVVRVVGYTGDLAATTGDGEVYLDGDFATIKGEAVDGKFVLTLPANADAEIRSPADRTELLDILGANKTSDDVWKFGKGSRKYSFSSEDGSLIVQGRAIVAEN